LKAISRSGAEAGGVFTLNVMPGLWKLKLFMEGIRNGYWKQFFVLGFYLLAVGTWHLALGHYGDALAKG